MKTAYIPTGLFTGVVIRAGIDTWVIQVDASPRGERDLPLTIECLQDKALTIGSEVEFRFKLDVNRDAVMATDVSLI